MHSTMARRRVKVREVETENGVTKHYMLTTHRNSHIEVKVTPQCPYPIEFTRWPHPGERLTEEESRCLVAILQRAHKLVEPEG
jgi:hypothetical protein